jgi:uncharacterized protein YodC (DUF2158 family)
MDKFQVGDVVVLRSGGPRMTVSEYVSVPVGNERVPRVRTYWFDERGKLRHDVFKEEVLKAP